MKCYYALAVTSHFVTHTIFRLWSSIEFAPYSGKCSDVCGETYRLHLRSSWIGFDIQYVFPNGTMNHYKYQRRPSFYQQRRESLTTYTQSYVRNCFFGWLTVSVARPEHQFPLNRSCTFKIHVTCTLHSGVVFLISKNYTVFEPILVIFGRSQLSHFHILRMSSSLAVANCCIVQYVKN
jgi:hypothetical protein